MKKDDPNRISKSFCVFPWTQIHVSPVGVVKPCCIFDGALKKPDGSTMIVSDLSAEEIWNGEHLREIRRKMLAGETVVECAKCIAEEGVGASSDRTIACHFSPDVVDRIADSRANDNRVSALPTSLNLKISNTCNLKCRMCQPIDSCGVDAEFSKISEKHPDVRKFDNASAFDYYASDEPIETLASWVSRPRSMKNLQELLGNADYMALAGGETTVTAEAMDLLRYCVSTGLSKGISLHISSNMTRISDELIGIFKAFKQVRVAASIDGTEGVLEYIRFPAKWEIVRKNFEKVLDAPGNIIPELAPTIQIYNILNIAELFARFEAYDHPKWFADPFCHMTVLYSPQFLSIRNLPKSVRRLALARLYEYIENSRFAQIDTYFRKKLWLLIATLQEEPSPDHRKQLSHFMQYTKLLDESREQNFSQCLPELAALLEDEKLDPCYPDGPEGKSFTFFRYKAAGFQYYKDARHQDAIAMFEKALILDGTDSESLFSKGISLKALGKTDEAEACFRKVYLDMPTHYYNVLALGFLEKERRNYDEAVSFFLRAKKLEPRERDGDCDRFVQDTRHLTQSDRRESV